MDKETRVPLAGANVIILNSNPLNGTTTDAHGKFRIISEVGRVTVVVSFLGYEEIVFPDILIASGKEVDLSIEMRENVMLTKEVIVSADKENNSGINKMASISTITIRTDDALRYAGGFFDASRIVSAFAGVANSNSDQSNDIIIRGNSSRGLLWRLEGIEIPNPNHFGDGNGGSGGAYSAITTNAISNFDFFTGAFPAEYGNAVSGVMDLNLRKGNSDKREFAFQTGMIGAEISAEGPFSKNSNSSFLIDARYVNFGYLSKLKLIDLGSTNFAPRSKDIVFNINLPSKKAGTLNIFGFAGNSSLGKEAIQDLSTWTTDDDRWEERQDQGSSVFGAKHVITLPGGSGFIRSVVAYTNFTDIYSEGLVDSSFNRTNSYFHSFRYPSVRLSVLINNKVTPNHTLRTGFNLSYLNAEMEDIRISSSGIYDTLFYPHGSGTQYQFYSQLKSRLGDNFEINFGFHTVAFSIARDMSVEPRLGFRLQFAPGMFFNSGVGLHSRIESLPAYFTLIKNPLGTGELRNKHLGFSKSFQFISGFDLTIARDLRLRLEAYNQSLSEIPIIHKSDSKYSAINTSEELPRSVLVNQGLGYNRGVELTIEKMYSKNYYYLFTLSLLDSKFKPGDGHWYNSYYNTSFVTNLLTGKDFYFGKNNRNSFGINLKSLVRGGYRYTPVDIQKSLKYKRIIYATSKTYNTRLPDFIRIDAGISFRRNNQAFSWIVMLDVQNATNHKNVFRKRFSYQNGSVITNNVYSLGSVPVVNIRIEF
jgi:hypothetical protein